MKTKTAARPKAGFTDYVVSDMSLAAFGRRELDLALNIDHALGADIGAGGDPGGTAEGIVAQLIDGQPVDLTDDLALQIYHQSPFADFILDPLLR